MRDNPLITQDHAARVIADAIRLRVGRGKRWSFASLSDATGIAQRTLESYVSGATPGMHSLLSICAALGPSFTSDILAVIGQTAQNDHGDEPDYSRALTQMAEGAALLAKCLEDGRVDHQEKAQLALAMAPLVELTAAIARKNESVVEIRGQVQ